MPKRSEDIDQLLTQITQKQPDIVEFRLDKLNDLNAVEMIARKKTIPAIATDRALRDPAIGKKLLLSAASSGFEYVDIDVSSPDVKDIVKMCNAKGAKVIVSSHNLRATPSESELGKTLSSVKDMGAEICKVVTTATHPGDNLKILKFVEDKSAETKIVSFAMGQLGIPSRILCPMFGAEFTFAAFSQESRTADGQLSIEDLRSVWQLLGVQ